MNYTHIKQPILSENINKIRNKFYKTDYNLISIEIKNDK